MKKWNLFAGVFHIFVGAAAIIAYIVVVACGESPGKWTITLLLAIAYVIMGVVNVIEYTKRK